MCPAGTAATVKTHAQTDFSYPGVLCRPAGGAVALRRFSYNGAARHGGRSYIAVALTPGRSPNRAFASKVSTMRSVCTACAAMIRS